VNAIVASDVEPLDGEGGNRPRCIGSHECQDAAVVVRIAVQIEQRVASRHRERLERGDVTSLRDVHNALEHADKSATGVMTTNPQRGIGLPT
jgi:hypothetical protein